MPSFAAVAARKKVRPMLHRNAISAPQRTTKTLRSLDARYSSPRNNDTMRVACRDRMRAAILILLKTRAWQTILVRNCYPK